MAILFLPLALIHGRWGPSRFKMIKWINVKNGRRTVFYVPPSCCRGADDVVAQRLLEKPEY